MNKNYSQPSRLEASFSKLKALHHRDDSVTFTPLEVMAMLHLIEPRSLGWDFVYGLATRSEADYEDCQGALEKLRQLTMSIPSNSHSSGRRPKAAAKLAPVLDPSYFDCVDPDFHVSFEDF